ncbi:MAG TPA: alternative ribosome rescue aminoacyl-tRNA hydrolase ArfB, partial [Thermoanaerobaculia bacterium]|nr:alternative ribosome rescue aminoacyl-tRNA hydrolase ArfB [Thermoanaerobaculia bacterium]
MVEIASGLSVPESELLFETSRSGGPGGQNVNKVESRVTLLFDLGASTSLSAEQKARIRERLATRISRSGVLRVVSSRHRTQGANKKAVLERLAELLQDALEVP